MPPPPPRPPPPRPASIYTARHRRTAKGTAKAAWCVALASPSPWPRLRRAPVAVPRWRRHCAGPCGPVGLAGLARTPRYSTASLRAGRGGAGQAGRWRRGVAGRGTWSVPPVALRRCGPAALRRDRGVAQTEAVSSMQLAAWRGWMGGRVEAVGGHRRHVHGPPMCRRPLSIRAVRGRIRGSAREAGDSEMKKLAMALRRGFDFLNYSSAKCAPGQRRCDAVRRGGAARAVRGGKA